MRAIHVQDIYKAIEQALLDINTRLPPDILAAVKHAIKKENTERARKFLQIIVENDELAHREKLPLCQDTGMVMVNLEIGQEVSLVGGDLTAAVNRGIREAYKKGYFRPSIVHDPIERINTGDNTPGIIYVNIVPGKQLHIEIMVKGAGSENMSQVRMLQPSAGLPGIKTFVMEVIKEAGANACPPLVVGVGIGGNLDKAAFLAKKALFRRLDQPHLQVGMALLEQELLCQINQLGIGPQGMGGVTTALGVNIETFPTHIASMPVAVNISCHLNRRTRITI